MKHLHLTALCTALGLSLLTACRKDTAFDRADINKNGVIERAEFDRAMLFLIFIESDLSDDGKVTFEEWKAVNPDTEPARFRVADADGDGGVTLEEGRAHYARQQTFTDMFGKMDTDKSGSLDRGEVTVFYNTLKAQATRTESAAQP